VERPAISTLIFVHATFDQLLDYKRRVDDRLKFRMTPLPTPPSRPTTPSCAVSAAVSQTTAVRLSHPSTLASRPTPGAQPSTLSPLTVPDTQMAAFIAVWANRTSLQATITPLTPLTPLSSSNPPLYSRPSSLDSGTQVEITSGPLAGHRATLLRPLTPRSRTARLSLPLSTLLTITLTLPTSSLYTTSSGDSAQLK